jgi:hypothetical protein
MAANVHISRVRRTTGSFWQVRSVPASSVDGGFAASGRKTTQLHYKNTPTPRLLEPLPRQLLITTQRIYLLNSQLIEGLNLLVGSSREPCCRSAQQD